MGWMFVTVQAIPKVAMFAQQSDAAAERRLTGVPSGRTGIFLLAKRIGCRKDSGENGMDERSLRELHPGCVMQQLKGKGKRCLSECVCRHLAHIL